MAALNEDAILIEYGNLWVGDDSGSLVDCGALRNIRFTAEQITTVINSDNRGEILRKSRMMGRVEADLLEPGDADTLENIFKGIITKSAVSGSPLSNETNITASGAWAYNTFIPFEYQDADGTAPVVDSVTGGTNGALTVNVDYIIVQHDDGRWGIMILDSSTVTTLSQTITVQIDVTPAASKVLTGGTNQTATPRYVKIIAPSEDDSNVVREIVLESAIASSPMLLSFVDVENAGDVGIMPVAFETRKGTNWTYNDEINS
jgi:hypothetical protein